MVSIPSVPFDNHERRYMMKNFEYNLNLDRIFNERAETTVGTLVSVAGKHISHFDLTRG